MPYVCPFSYFTKSFDPVLTICEYLSGMKYVDGDHMICRISQIEMIHWNALVAIYSDWVKW